MSCTVDAILCGTATPFRGDEKSAIAKVPVEGRVRIEALGIAGDEQADLVHHGGPDMAVHHYPFDHHAAWREDIGKHELLANPGAFGTNLSVTGLTEHDVLLGDRFRLGTALLEACQPRQPCWKIEHRFGRKGMVAAILKSGRCGWFYRVVEPGEAQAGDALERVETGLPDWSMARIFDTIWGIGSPKDPALLKQITTLPRLAEKLRSKVQKRIGG